MVIHWTWVRRLSAALLFGLPALATSADDAWATCTPSGANQTCVNSSFLSNSSAPGIYDTGTLTVTNTASGVIGLAANSNPGIVALNADATNYGSINGLFGVYGNASATVNNSGTISGSIAAIFADSGSAVVTNSGTVSGGSTAAIGALGNISLTNSGSVTGAYGVWANGGTATVTNSGTITATTQGAIYATGNVSVTNSGTLSSYQYAVESLSGGITLNNSGTISNQFGYAAFAPGTVNVTNSGSIFGAVASGTELYLTNTGTIASIEGAIGASDAHVINSGTIATTYAGVGVGFGTATVVNTGTITASSSLGAGVSSGNAVNVTNSGLISGGADGVLAQGGLGLDWNSTITNSGTISGGQYGIFTYSSLTLTNSGTISGGTAALQLFRYDNITLLPGSRIIGAINLGFQDTININATNQNLTFNSLATATITGSVPYIVSGNRIVSVGVSGFAGTDRDLLAFIDAVAGPIGSVTPAAADGSGGALGFAGPDYVAANADEAFAELLGYAKAPSDAVLFKNPTVTTADGTTVWARGFYGQRLEKADGPSLANVTNFYGGAIGFDRQVAPDLKLGGLAGGGHISTTIDQNAGSSASDLGYAGIYGRKDFGSAFVDFDIIAGGSSNSSVRSNINNNLVAGGIETATASFGGWFVSPEAVAGNRFQLTPEWTLTPAARLRYLAAGFGGYTETGTTAGMTVGSRLAQALEQRGELTLTHTLTSDLGRFQIGSTFGVIGQERVGGGTINAQILGQALSFATPGKASIGGGFVAGQFDWKTPWGATLFATAEYTAYSDSSTVLTGHAGIRVGF
jgi:hypothetical protein